MNILEKANKIVNERSDDRDYPEPVESLRRVAAIFNMVSQRHTLDKMIQSSDVALMQILLKLERHCNSDSYKDDNMVDICGYAQIIDLIEEAKNPTI